MAADRAASAPTSPTAAAPAAPAPSTAAATAAAASVAETSEPSPTDLVKAEKAGFAMRMKRARKAVKEKAAAKPSGAKPAPAAPAAATDAETDTSTDAPEPGQAAASGKSPRELLEAGDLDGAFEAAFGKKPHDFKIDPRRWEEWRKAGQRQKRELAERKARDEAEIADKRRTFSEELAEARRMFGPLAEAAKLYKAGDVVGAIQRAFGDDINAFQKKALAQFHGKNPEVEALRRELEEERRSKTESERKERERREAEESRRAIQNYREQLRAELIEGGDPVLARLAVQDAFILRVWQIKRERFDFDSRTTVSTSEAAAMARRELVERFGSALGASADRSVSAESDRAGSKPAQAENGKKPPSRTLSQRGATEASEPGRALSDTERRRKYTDLALAQRAAG